MIFVGCAGWALSKAISHEFPGTGTHLQKYASRFDAVELNSSFYRPHKHETYVRWAESVPGNFNFSVKLPKEITHARRLEAFAEPLERFRRETAGLGDKLGPVLVQLPPSLGYRRQVAREFFTALRARFPGRIVCEPRHASWFGPEAEALLSDYRIARAAADPALVPSAREPGGCAELVYYRWHGSPRLYYSAYPEEALATLSRALRRAADRGAEAWCIFDNTALGAAIPNALGVLALLGVERGEQLVGTRDVEPPARQAG